MISAPAWFRGEGEPTSWQDVEKTLESAEMIWVTTLRDGKPHTVPVLTVWWERALYSCCPRTEQKCLNMMENPTCQMMTGCSKLSADLDVVVNGTVEEVADHVGRQRFSEQLPAVHGEAWSPDADDHSMFMYRLIPTHICAFHRFDPMNVTRWDFECSSAK